jgi:hypothetical protein
MRKRPFGRWAARLVLAAALGAGLAVAGVAADGGSRTPGDVQWQTTDIQWQSVDAWWSVDDFQWQ